MLAVRLSSGSCIFVKLEYNQVQHFCSRQMASTESCFHTQEHIENLLIVKILNTKYFHSHFIPGLLVTTDLHFNKIF